MRKIIIILIVLILTGCTSVSDGLRFKQEYEKYNDTLHKVSIDEDNYIIYASTNKIIEIINSGTGVIFIGNEQDNECRQMISTLIEAANSTNLEKIYYLRETQLDAFTKYVDKPQVPLVLFVYEGEIVSYKQGIGNNENLTPEEREDLFNIYVSGIHKVLNDMCDEECND